MRPWHFPFVALLLAASSTVSAQDGGGLQLRTAPTLAPPRPAASSVGGWTCPPGTTQRGSACVGVQVPANATLDLSGRVWTCNRGYRRSGNACETFLVPPNAELDLMGTGWVCQTGYVRQNTRCVPKAG